MLWLSFVAVYAYVGSRFSHWLDTHNLLRATSTCSMFVAGVLLLAVLAHIMSTTDKERTRCTLVIAFGASGFLVDTSLDKYTDPLAAGITGIFAILLARLIWLPTTDRHYFATQYTALVSMGIALLCGIIGFPLTLAVKRLAFHYYVFGPEDTWIVCGLACGLIMGSGILPESLPFQNEISSRQSRLKFSLEIAGFAGLSGMVLLLVNRTRPILYSPNLHVRIPCALAYAAIYVGFGSLWLRRLKGGLSRFPLVVLIRYVLAMGLLAGTAIWLMGFLQSHRTSWLTQVLLELVYASVFLICLGIATSLLRRVGGRIASEYRRQSLNAA